MAAHAIELWARRAFGTHRFEPLWTALEDRRNAAECFDIVDDRRLRKSASDGRERRLVAWPAALAFERFEQSGFFSADIRPRPAVHIAFELVLGAEDPIL